MRRIYAVRFRVETVAANLEIPRSIVFAPDGRMIFTERPGRVRVSEGGRLRAEPLAVIEDVAAGIGGAQSRHFFCARTAVFDQPMGWSGGKR